MSDGELTECSARVDITAVRAYRDAVGLRTRDVVAALPTTRWAEPITAIDAARVPTWFKVFEAQPRALELATSAITHNAMHLGEAVTVRSLVTGGGPS